jgi:methionyl-tRNA formyltransferase
MKVVYLGSGEFGIECLNALVSSNHDLMFIVTQPTQPAGRGKKLRPTPVADWAKERGVDFIETDNVNAPDMVRRIAGHEPETIVVVAFGQKIGKELINLPSKSAINAHASLLPKYRGAAPINWAIINGETETGVTIIKMAERMDAGDIVAQTATEIGPDETAGELHDRLAGLAAPLLVKTLDRIAAGTASYAPQDHSQATLAPKLRKSDGFLDFTQPAENLRNRIRGLWPRPGASALYHSRRTEKSQHVTIAMAHIVDTANPANVLPGTLDEYLNVICGKNALRITTIKPAGSSLMDFKAFVNGRQTAPGDTFATIRECT